MLPSQRRIHEVLRSGVAVALVSLAAVWSAGQETQPAACGPVGGLRAELRAVRPLFDPDHPVRLRFTLINTTADPIAVPLEYPVAGDAVALPVQLALGSGDRRLVSVSYEGDTPEEVPAPPPPAKWESCNTLRIGPHGTVGLELDLRKHFPAVRYTGNYKVEWRPLGGAVAPATAEFRVEPRKDVILITDLPGKIIFTLDYDAAPQNVENFTELVRQGFYNGLTFHRVVPGYLIQGGCPNGDGKGIRKDGKLVPAEFRDFPVDAGTLLMARRPSEPNSASCQFFVALGRLPELDGQYTVIGHTRDAESLRTLHQLAEVPTDRRDRPLSPLIIRSLNLVDAESARTRELEVESRRTDTPGDAVGRQATQ